jgi:hypothetical protein
LRSRSQSAVGGYAVSVKAEPIEEHKESGIILDLTRCGQRILDGGLDDPMLIDSAREHLQADGNRIEQTGHQVSAERRADVSIADSYAALEQPELSPTKAMKSRCCGAGWTGTADLL